jgi:hypothetical protein
MSGRHIARRGLIACSALLLVAGEAGAAKAQELDGKLIALCREFQDAEAIFAAWDAERDFMPFNHPRAREIDKLERALVNRRHKIREEVAELKAHTPEGLQAKARMVMTEFAEEADPDSESCNHQYLAASLWLVTSWGGPNPDSRRPSFSIDYETPPSSGGVFVCAWSLPLDRTIADSSFGGRPTFPGPLRPVPSFKWVFFTCAFMESRRIGIGRPRLMIGPLCADPGKRSV